MHTLTNSEATFDMATMVAPLPRNIAHITQRDFNKRTVLAAIQNNDFDTYAMDALRTFIPSNMRDNFR
jgi:hypothetical protein